METRVDEIADSICRLSAFVPDVGPTGFTFNQFLIDADEPAIHTGPRGADGLGRYDDEVDPPAPPAGRLPRRTTFFPWNSVSA